MNNKRIIGIIFVVGLLSITPFFSAEAATSISSCGVLDQADEVYTLTQDVSSSGTCIAISADDITLNLNGYTITYGTGTGENFFGIAMPPGYVTDITRAQFPGLPDSAFGGGFNAIIYNGTINQGAGNGSNSHAIRGRSGTEIYSTTSTVQGDDTDNILFEWSNGLRIHDNVLNNNSTVVTNRHQGKEVIGSLRDSGNTKIYNNTINGGPQYGIRLTHNSGGETGFEIYGNTISQNAVVSNPYSIGVYADNTKVYDNIITPINGRGIHVERNNVEVYNNTITVKEGPNGEYAGGWSHGIKMEGSTNAYVHDNTVTALAGGAYGSAYALDVSVAADSNNRIYNNIFTATTSESGEIAAAAHLLDVSAGNGLDIYNNTFRTNNYNVFADWDGASDVLFRSNTFEITGSPINYAMLRFTTGTVPSEDLKFLNSTLGTGVSLEDVSYRADGANLSYEIQQYLEINSSGIGDVSISITDINGTTVASGTSDSNGYSIFSLTTYTYNGKPPTKTTLVPHTVTISKSGYKTATHIVTLNSSQTLNVTLVATSSSQIPVVVEEEYTAPSIPQGSSQDSSTNATPTTTPSASTPVESSGSFFAYASNLRGGFHVTAGNVMKGSQAEIIVGTKPGMGPQVRVFSSNGDIQAQFFAYASNLRNGVTVTACDVNGDGYKEIITAQGRGGWPLVKIFDGYGNVINDGFYVLDGKFTGGVNVACGDIHGDGISEIVVSAMHGGGPHVLVYNLDGRVLANFMAYDANFRGGINVTTADADGDGADEIITGPQWGSPHVQIFQIRHNDIHRLSPGFYAFHPDYKGGVSVAGVDTDGDGTKEIVIGVGSDATPLVKIFNIQEELQKTFYVYDHSFLGGVHLTGGDVDGDGADELMVIPRSSGGPQVRIIEVGSI